MTFSVENQTSEIPAGPGRPREFDPGVALAAALDLFWRQGYEATSLEELTLAMGISRSSFYGCFGSKHGVLLAAIRRYSDEKLAALTAAADGEKNPREAVRIMVAAIADAAGGPKGCFLVNCIAELAPHDTEVAEVSRRHLDRIERLIADRLARRLDQTAAEDRARALLSLALGTTMLRKAGMAEPRIDALLTQIDSLLPSP